MIRTIDELKREIKNRGMTYHEFEVRISILSGEYISITKVEHYATHGRLTYVQRAFVNFIFGCAFEEFEKLGAFEWQENQSETQKKPTITSK